jgi:hypothetical protein
MRWRGAAFAYGNLIARCSKPSVGLRLLVGQTGGSRERLLVLQQNGLNLSNKRRRNDNSRYGTFAGAAC